MKKIRALIASVFTAATLFNTTAVFADIDFSISQDSFFYDYFSNSVKTGEITVYTDGTPVKFDVSPQIINDRTMVPLRAIFEALGAEVSWDDITKTAISVKDGKTVKITIGKYILSKNDVDIKIDVPAQIVDSRTLVPVRAIAESFDCKVFWDGDSRTVRIVTEDLPEAVPTEADITAKIQINDRSFSEAEYSAWNFFASENEADNSQTDSSDNENVVETLKTIYAYEKYLENHNITLTDAEKDCINHTVAVLRNTGLYDKALAECGLTDASYRRSLELNFAVIKASFYAPEISEQEIIEHCRNSLVRAKHILVKSEKEAIEVLAQLNAGESFEKLAAEKSLDGMDIENGYIFGKNEMVKEFEEAAFSLKENEISGIVKSPYGYHIIKRYPLPEITDGFPSEKQASIARYEINTEKMKNEITKIKENLSVTQP